MKTYTFSNGLNGEVLFIATMTNATRILNLKGLAGERIKREVETEGRCELFFSLSSNIFYAASIIITKGD